MPFSIRPTSPFFTHPLLLCTAMAASAAPGQTSAPPVTQVDSRAAVLEANWTPLTMPTGERTALLGVSYMIMSEGGVWAIGPGAYGAAQGDYGGLFTAGFNPAAALAAFPRLARRSWFVRRGRWWPQLR
jgi:hypothetical protein